MSTISETALRLVTVLNTVSSRRPIEDDKSNSTTRPAKLNKKIVSTSAAEVIPGPTPAEDSRIQVEEAVAEADESTTSLDTYELHFGAEADHLTTEARTAVDDGQWKIEPIKGKLGSALKYTPSNTEPRDSPAQKATVSPQLRGDVRFPKACRQVVSKLKESLEKLGSSSSRSQQAVQSALWDWISSYQDLFISRVPLETHSAMRDTISLHIANHIHKIRRRILKNNDRIAHAPKDEPPDNIQDQGFTRPSILILLPFRSFAVRWLTSITSHLPGLQIENHSRFNSEYLIPPNAVDKLLAAEPGTYPPDHVDMMQGNIDDDFKLGIKLTRKSMKLYSEFYSSDILIASPLGLRRTIEKDGNGDFLSSMEILTIDQMDALTMQNWDHLLTVMSHVNQLPKESHDTDFSRVKPWYLDNHAKYVRQTILLSPYESPEMRSFFNQLTNIAGKVRTRAVCQPVAVPEGIRQVFTPFDCSDYHQEPDQRFNYFTTQLFPSILKSAVQSVNTVIFVPSYFDFVRVRQWLKQQKDVSLAVLFEESTNADISRARQAFFSGTKSFLLTTERFHFFRRYKIRGIRNVIFYAPPDHSQFYSEFLSFPFLDEEVSAEDVTCRVLYCKWDVLRLERIMGSEKVKGLLGTT